MRGFTILELLIVMLLVAILLAIAVPRGRAALDRAVVRSAASDVRATLGFARALAVAAHATVTVDVHASTGTLRVRRGGLVVRERAVGGVHGVHLGSTRDSVAYDSYGMGRGAANLSVMVRRGAAAETVFVSRLGRIR